MLRKPIRGTWRPIDGIKGRVCRYAWTCICGRHTEYVLCSEGYKYGTGRREYCPKCQAEVALICERYQAEIAREVGTGKPLEALCQWMGRSKRGVRRLLHSDLFGFRQQGEIVFLKEGARELLGEKVAS